MSCLLSDGSQPGGCEVSSLCRVSTGADEADAEWSRSVLQPQQDAHAGVKRLKSVLLALHCQVTV